MGLLEMFRKKSSNRLLADILFRKSLHDVGYNGTPEQSVAAMAASNKRVTDIEILGGARRAFYEGKPENLQALLAHTGFHPRNFVTGDQTVFKNMSPEQIRLSLAKIPVRDLEEKLDDYLLYAVLERQDQLVPLLISAGAKPSHEHLIIAVRLNDLDTADVLIKSGRDLVEQAITRAVRDDAGWLVKKLLPLRNPAPGTLEDLRAEIKSLTARLDQLHALPSASATASAAKPAAP